MVVVILGKDNRFAGAYLKKICLKSMRKFQRLKVMSLKKDTACAFFLSHITGHHAFPSAFCNSS